MNDHATRVLNATAAGQEVMAENSALWNTKQAIVDKHAAINEKVDEIVQLEDQITEGTGPSDAKKVARENAAILALKIGKPMSIFAKDTNNLELYAEVDLPWSSIRYGKDQVCIDHWQLIHDRSVTHQTALVADGYIESTWTGLLATAITDFGALRGKPKAKRSTEKAMNEAINVKVKELQTLKTDLLDLLVQFNDTNPEFYAAVSAAFDLDNSGMRHQALRINYTDDTTAIRLFGVQASIQELGITRKSSKAGVVIFSRQELATGNYILRSELSNYEPIVIENIGIDHLKLVTIDIPMVKSGGGTGPATGSIAGTVRQMGNTVANVAISVQGQPISTISEPNGKYLLSGLSPGNLSITATLPPTLGGLSKTEQVSLSAGQTLQLDFNF